MDYPGATWRNWEPQKLARVARLWAEILTRNHVVTKQECEPHSSDIQLSLTQSNQIKIIIAIIIVVVILNNA